MKKTNKKVLGLGALVVGGLLLKKAADSKKEAANLQTLFAPEAIASEQTESNYILDAIKNDPAVRAYIKSLGITGEQVVNQINQNVYNLEGVQYQNFGGSLLVNGAGELGSTQNNRNAVFSLVNSVPTFDVSSTAYLYNDTRIKFIDNRLYRVRLLAKGVGGLYSYVFNYNIEEQGLTRTFNNYLGAYPILNQSLTTNFQEFVGYCGGRDTAAGATKFHALTDNIKVGILISGGGSIQKMIFEVVDLGEPVPDNLPWLPTGQMVYDTTTGEVGRYNGTTVDYFAMAI